MLTVHGDGEQRRDFTYVSDVVDALLNETREVVDVQSGVQTSIHELRTMFDRQALHPAFSYGPKREGEIAHPALFITTPSIWQCETSLVHGIKETCRWWRKIDGTRTPDGTDAA